MKSKKFSEREFKMVVDSNMSKLITTLSKKMESRKAHFIAGSVKGFIELCLTELEEGLKMKKDVYIVCGVPASGKSWVCTQLKDKYQYIPHDGWDQRFEKTGDDYLDDYSDLLADAAKKSKKPILGDCPFAERKLRALLKRKGVEPKFVFLKVDGSTLQERYKERKKPLPKGHVTRLTSIPDRAKEWEAFYGTSSEALEHLKSL